jgi:hypothetical protein
MMSVIPIRPAGLGLVGCEVAGAGGGMAQAAVAYSMVEVSGLALPSWVELMAVVRLGT